MNSPPLVYVVILNWNAPAETLACLDSVYALDYPNFQVVVVDNGSQDDSLALLRADGRGFQLIENETNLGFCGGSNKGIQRALADQAEFVWLVNNDAKLDPDCLSALVAAMADDARLGLVSPVIYDLDDAGGVQDCGAIVDWHRCEVNTLRDISQARDLHRTHVDDITVYGTAMLVRRRVFEDVGLLDEDFFIYWDDNDIAIRSIRAGYRCAVVFTVGARHRPPYVAGKINRPAYYYYFNVRNRYFTWRRHLRGWARRRFLVQHLTGSLNYVMECLSHDDPAGLDASLLGLWDAWCGRSGRWHADRRPPRWLRAAVASHPYLLQCVLRGDARAIGSLLLTRLRGVRAGNTTA